MNVNITSGSPRSIPLGIQDLSKGKIPRYGMNLPQHLPLLPIMAAWGPTTGQVLGANDAALMYHEDSFDYTKKWANHATVVANIMRSRGNIGQYFRIVDPDVNTKSCFRLSIEVVDSYEDDFIRDAETGNYSFDKDGLPKRNVGVKVSFKKIRWVAEKLTGVIEETVGLGAVTDGTMIGNDENGLATVQSKRYPIMDGQAPFFGKRGDLTGIRLWAPTDLSSTPINTMILEDPLTKAYPYRFAFVEKADETATPKFVESLFGENYLEVSLKKGARNTTYNKLVYAGHRLINDFQLLNDENYADQYGPLGEVHVYDENIELVLKALYAAELPFINYLGANDFDGSEDEHHRLNFVSALNSSGVPYYRVLLDTSLAGSLRLSESTTIYLNGGDDGKVTELIFNDGIDMLMDQFADPDDNVMDDADFPVSHFYDSGYRPATKFNMCKFISQRKDTFVVLGTHVAGGPKLTAAEEHSLGAVLYGRLSNYPDSEYFGTPVIRGLIMGRSGILIDSEYTERLPLTIEIAFKSSRYMGAANGAWTNGQLFDAGDNAMVEMFKDINVTFTSSKVRNKDWDVGLNWVQTYTHKTYFYPALRTVYDDDTSILTSYFNVCALCYLQKIVNKAWKRHSGSVGVDEGVFLDRINKYVTKETSDIFDNIVKIVPNAYKTSDDALRGFSWTLGCSLYGNNMETVQAAYLQARRMSDYTGE